jgi:hypothetical protein
MGTLCPSYRVRAGASHTQCANAGESSPGSAAWQQHHYVELFLLRMLYKRLPPCLQHMDLPLLVLAVLAHCLPRLQRIQAQSITLLLCNTRLVACP